MSKNKTAMTGAERGKKLRDALKETGGKWLRIPVSPQEAEKLKQITEFYGWPNQNLSETETLQLMIHRFHSELDAKQKELGCCKQCGEQLPQGCAKLKAGGLFKGDANCFHTTNRMAITPLKLENLNEHS